MCLVCVWDGNWGLLGQVGGGAFTMLWVCCIMELFVLMIWELFA